MFIYDIISGDMVIATAYSKRDARIIALTLSPIYINVYFDEDGKRYVYCDGRYIGKVTL